MLFSAKHFDNIKAILIKQEHQQFREKWRTNNLSLTSLIPFDMTSIKTTLDRMGNALSEDITDELQAKRAATASVVAPIKKTRADGQISGLAGELFVAAELLKRGLQTSVTFGNAKSIDLLAHCPQTERVFIVQVKTVRSRNWFLLSRTRIQATHVYVFVILNRPGAQVQYFIVPGSELLANDALFAKGLSDPKMPGVYPTALSQFENNWSVFEPL